MKPDSNPEARALRQLVRRSGGGEGALLQTLADTAAEAIFLVDRDRNVVFFNHRAEELTGFRREEVLGRHCLTGFRCATCLESCTLFARGRVASPELQIFRKDGRRARVSKSGHVVRDGRGAIAGAVEVFRELADSAPAEQSGDADVSFAAVDRAMAVLGRGVVLLDPGFVVERISSVLASLMGPAAPSAVGQPAVALLGEELFGKASPFRAALEVGERREGWRALVTRADGSPAPVSVTGAPLSAGEGCGAARGGGYLLIVRPEEALQLDDGGPVSFEGMVGRSPAMRRVFQLIEHLRQSDATVLISGDSGTGKELVARAIHARSARANQPFVAINCGALPADLLESELFGHVRGAFTGAVRNKPGRIEVAAEGTVFLDEIGDLPLPLQVKLLRVLQERTFERVGDTTTRPVRARVVAATLQDLERAVAQKRFREDLFYRLNVVRLALPPLRERREDLDLLIVHLMEKISRRRSRILRLSPAAMRALLDYGWPGNVRQLENALEYATAVCSGQTIHREDLPPEVTEQPRAVVPAPAAASEPPAPQATVTAPAKLEPYPPQAELLDALRRTHHRRTEAARLLGVSRTTLWRRMKELGLA